MLPRQKLITIVLFVSIFLVTACSSASPEQPPIEEIDTNISDMAANPAALYCTGLGYTLESVSRDGGEDADCVFPDESRCPQWDFMAGRCGQEFSLCETQNHDLVEGKNFGTCKFADGSSCDEFEYFKGECKSEISAPPKQEEPSGVGLANPAATYCAGLGYTYEPVSREGGEDADCVFPDETRCAQWDFMAGRCGQEFSHCKLQGYDLVEGMNIATCNFPDGSTCDEFMFFSEECAEGDNPAAE
jgi:putative hemolysin